MDHADSERPTDNPADTSDTSSDDLSGSPTSSPAPNAVAALAVVSVAAAPGRGGQRGGSGDGAPVGDVDDRNDIELPEPMSEGRPSAEAAERALVRKPRIGDTMPMPMPMPTPTSRRPVLHRRDDIGRCPAAVTVSDKSRRRA
jgi:hypothetical protein